jgi:beta,beta-carotene 9',10'-dioxygenase
MTNEYALGFRSIDREHDERALAVDGHIPDWLDGSLIRNGPAKFDVGDERVEHWFDGLGMLTQFTFRDGSVAYSNRFLRSEEYHEVTDRGRRASSQFGTSDRGTLGKIRDWVVPTPTDNANVNVVRIGDRFVAITETQVGIEFDPATLETVDRFPFDSLAGQMMTAHPHVDPWRGETVTFTTEFGRTNRYRVYQLPHGTERFRPIGTVTTRRPSYMHSFALTANHVVLVEFPFDVNPLTLLLPDSDAFIERYQWRPDEGTQFIVMDRDTGDIVTKRTAEPFFAFHHVNAFEDGDTLVVDIAAFDEPDVIDALYLENLESDPLPAIEGELRRYRVPITGNGIERETLYSDGMTLPRISPYRNTRPYRYAYGQGTPIPADSVRQRLLKVDTHEREAVEWAEPDTYCGEPVFVPHPRNKREDDGVVLSVILETGTERSSLLLLDRLTFEEIGRAPLPHVVPFDFHGQFFPEL